MSKLGYFFDHAQFSAAPATGLEPGPHFRRMPRVITRLLYLGQAGAQAGGSYSLEGSLETDGHSSQNS